MHTPVKKGLLDMLNAVADESRLALLEALYQGERSAGDLAQQVGLAESTVSHHLAKLHNAQLISLRMAGSQRFYRLNHDGLKTFKKLVTEIEQPLPVPVGSDSDDAWIAALGWDPADQQVLRDHTEHGQLLQIPSKQKKLVVVLRWLATLFEPDRLYTESEVNAVLKAIHEADYVGLRRDLVDYGYLRRERGGGKYWLTPADEQVTTGQAQG